MFRLSIQDVENLRNLTPFCDFYRIVRDFCPTLKVTVSHRAGSALRPIYVLHHQGEVLQFMLQHRQSTTCHLYSAGSIQGSLG